MTWASNIVTILPDTIIPASGQVNSSGNNTLLTPASGKFLRLFYVSYNPLAAVECAFRFGAAGELWLRNNITGHSIVSKEFGPRRSLDGEVGAALVLNLSGSVAVIWNAFYAEV